jgi:tRNA threonylcarbamoyladenosine biosynthesis protein TsaE
MRSWTTADPAATRRVGEELAAELAPDGVLLLSGDLGTGKTVLTQGLAQGLGIDPGEVQSPTFTLVREHQGAGATRLVPGTGAGATRVVQVPGTGAGATRVVQGAGATRLVHVDLYRLEPAEAAEIGLDELLAGPGVKVVEWAERLPFEVPGALRLTLRRTAEGREIREEPAPRQR